MCTARFRLKILFYFSIPSIVVEDFERILSVNCVRVSHCWIWSNVPNDRSRFGQGSVVQIHASSCHALETYQNCPTYYQSEHRSAQYCSYSHIAVQISVLSVYTCCTTSLQSNKCTFITYAIYLIESGR